MKKSKYLRSYMVTGLLLVFSVVAWIGSYDIYRKKPGIANAGMYPLLLASLMILFLIGALIETIVQQRHEIKNETQDKMPESKEKGSLLIEAIKEEFPAETVFLGACIVVYAVLFHFFGFYISTSVFLLLTIVGLYKGKKVGLAVGVTAGTMLAVYLVIEKIFNIPLP